MKGPQCPCYLLHLGTKHGAAHVNNEHHVFLNRWEASGGKVMNKIAVVNLDKKKVKPTQIVKASLNRAPLILLHNKQLFSFLGLITVSS